MKKTITSIIVILVAAGAVTWFTIWSKRSVNTQTEHPAVSTPANPTIKPEMVSVAEDSYLLGIGGSYPQFSQADAAFNKKIAEAVQAGIKDFKESVNADYKARLETGGDEFQKEFEKGGLYTYEVEATIVQSDASYVSAVIHVGGYSGGAHGFRNAMTFNYDVKKQKEMALEDFGDIKNMARMATLLLLDKFTEQKVLDSSLAEMIYAGTDASKPENFSNFTFNNKKELTLYFGEYQVAPYVFGEQVVEIGAADTGAGL